MLPQYRSMKLLRLTQISLRLQRQRLAEGDFRGEADMSRSSPVSHVCDALHLVPGTLHVRPSGIDAPITSGSSCFFGRVAGAPDTAMISDGDQFDRNYDLSSITPAA